MKLVTIEQATIGSKTYIFLFTRDGPTRQKIVIDNFRPYFYILEEEYSPDFHPNKKENLEKFKTLTGETVIKFHVQTPGDVPHFRKMFSKTWEADVPFCTRYLIDKVPKLDPVNLRVQYTDIEWDQETDQIISIAVYDNYLNKCVAFVWRKDLKPKVEQKNYVFPKTGYRFNASIHYYSSRESMLQDYIKFIRQTDPDVLTGWYFTKYDMPGIINSINTVKGLSAAWLSPIGKAYVEEERFYGQDVVVKGRVVWDTLKAYENLQPTGLPDASLEAIAQKELGEGKYPLDKPISWLWRNDIEALVEYNCKDSVLVYRIDNKCKILDYYDSLRRWVGCEWNHLFSATQMWDTYILRKVHDKVVLPTKKRVEIERIKGAEVFTPQKGVHEWVVVLDLKSLYPSNIVTFNMSPETLVRGKPEPNRKVYNLPNGVSFYAEPVGLFPSILMELDEERNKYKVLEKQYPFGTSEYYVYFHLQEGIKKHKNALYGASVHENFRLATRDIGKTTTFVGRKVVNRVRQRLINRVFKVLYGDTDSVFYFSKKNNLSDIIEEMESVVEDINSDLKNLVEELGGDRENCHIRIEPKKIYRHLLITQVKSGKRGAKKRYAGRVVWAEGKEVDELDIMGFEFRRSNTSQLTRDLQKKIFRVLFKYEPREKLKAYIKEAKEKLASADYEYFGIPQSITKPFGKYKTDNPWVRGAKWSNEYLGLKFTVGDKPKILYVRDVPKDYPKTDVMAFRRNSDVPPGTVVDVEKMFEKAVIMKLEQILDAANLSVEEIVYGQTSLDQF